MINEKTVQELQKKGYKVSTFKNRQEAVDYLKGSLQGKTIGFGGSQTLTEMDLRHVLAENNTLYVPDFAPEGENFFSMTVKAAHTDVYMLSANAVSEDGEIINIDGYGNRLASSLFGHKKVIYIIGRNKIGGNLEEAVKRARNIAGPKNSLRLHHKTPCAMSVVDELEKKFRDKYNVEGSIDQLEWQRFIEKLSPSEMNTHCYDCRSPQTICRSLLIDLTALPGMETEIIIIDEDMGF